MLNVIYFVPCILTGAMFVFFGLISSFSNIHSFAWVIVGVLGLAGYLLKNKKWWGSLFGIAVGLIAIYAGTKDTGQWVNEMPVGFVLCGYYVVCAILCTFRK